MQQTGFQMRLGDGAYKVYMVRADGQEVPVERQRVVYSRRSMGSAQAVCDALNSGLLTIIGQAVYAERAERQET